MNKLNANLQRKNPGSHLITNFYNHSGQRRSSHSTPEGPPPSDFDEENGKFLKLPSKPPLRTYQERAVRKCVRSNTLVCLPTGSGKTLIAATVIKNFISWYPRGQGEKTNFGLFYLNRIHINLNRFIYFKPGFENVGYITGIPGGRKLRYIQCTTLIKRGCTL